MIATVRLQFAAVVSHRPERTGSDNGRFAAQDGNLEPFEHECGWPLQADFKFEIRNRGDVFYVFIGLPKVVWETSQENVSNHRGGNGLTVMESSAGPEPDAPP